MKHAPRKTPAKNPPLVIFGNPPRRARALLGDVKAIVYQHATTGELMVHGFGPRGEAIRLEDLRDGVAIRRLPRAETRAQAIANADGTVTIRNADGQRLWADL